MNANAPLDLRIAQSMAKNGDLEPFNNWFVLQYPKFRGWAQRFCSNEEIANDAHHRLYFKLREKLVGDAEICDAYAWRVLRSLIRDQQIAENRKSKTTVQLLLAENIPWEGVIQINIESQEFETALRQGIEQLNENEKNVIRLAFQLGTEPIKITLKPPFSGTEFENWPIIHENDASIIVPSKLTSASLRQVGQALGLSDYSVYTVKDSAISKLRRFLIKST